MPASKTPENGGSKHSLERLIPKGLFDFGKVWKN
jgi:hypothetical protein